MKKTGGFLFTAYCALLTVSVWITVAAASVRCFLEAFGLIELIFGFNLYAFAANLLWITGPLALLLLIGLFVLCYRDDRKNPGCPAVVKLGSDVSAWLLQFDMIFFGVAVTKRTILFIRFLDAAPENLNGPIGFILYLMSDGWLFLILGAVLAAAHLICKKLCKDNKY